MHFSFFHEPNFFNFCWHLIEQFVDLFISFDVQGSLVPLIQFRVYLIFPAPHFLLVWIRIQSDIFFHLPNLFGEDKAEIGASVVEEHFPKEHLRCDLTSLGLHFRVVPSTQVRTNFCNPGPHLASFKVETHFPAGIQVPNILGRDFDLYDDIRF